MVSKDPQGWQQLKDVNNGWNGKVALLKDKPKLVLPPLVVGWIFPVGIILSLEITRRGKDQTRLCGGSLDSLVVGCRFKAAMKRMYTIITIVHDNDEKERIRDNYEKITFLV